MNKRMMWVVSIVMILGVKSMAIDFMGPPSASLKEGQSKIGFTYHQSKNDITLKNIKVDGVDFVGDVDIKDVEFTRNYFTYNCGLATDRMEIYGFLGASEAESKNYDFGGENAQFSGDKNFAAGGGVKITTNLDEKVDWGILLQASWLKPKGDIEGVKIEADVVEFQIAAGPTFKINENWKIYGGPFACILRGDAETTNTVTKVEGDLEEGSAVGGYIGTQIDLSKNVAIAIEYASTGDSSGFGVNISWKF